MNKYINKFLRSRTSKRLISGMTALAMLCGAVPLGQISDQFEELDFGSLFARAADNDIKFPHDETTNKITIRFDDLSDYAQDYQDHPEYHQFDNIEFYANSAANAMNKRFKGIGTDLVPFGGSIYIGPSLLANTVINIDGPLFNCVYDDVYIYNEYSYNHGINISRVYVSETLGGENSISTKTPLFAKKIVKRPASDDNENEINDENAVESSEAEAVESSEAEAAISSEAEAAVSSEAEAAESSETDANENNNEAYDNENNNANATNIWNINIVTPSYGDSGLGVFGGVIGTIDDDASVVMNVTMNTSEGDTDPAIINGESATGFACGIMNKNSSLEFSLISDRGVDDIITSTGNVGGLVGMMDEGSTFTYIGENPQSGSLNIQTDNGYAGGIVGVNNKGTVLLKVRDNSDNILDRTTPYPVGQIIEGSDGSGGLYGHYIPSSDSALAFDVKDYYISYIENGSEYTCQVNGNGDCGGLFGVLECSNAVDITDTTSPGNTQVKSSHALGNAKTYGGLIGKYINTSGNDLSVSNIVTNTACGGSANNYGGAIGIIDDTDYLYAKFNSFTVVSTNTGSLIYGGLVASADNAFVDAEGITVTANGYKGGGLVGSLDHGVLRMRGTIDLSGAVPSSPGENEEHKVGQFVGWRDDALVFAEDLTDDHWTFNRCSTSVAVDDIGAWGEVLRFDSVTNTQTVTPVTTDSLNNASVLSVNESTHQVTIGACSTSIANKADYAKTALCFQIDASNNNFITNESTYTYSTISTQAINLTGNIVLAGTGFGGLTRDNDIGTEHSADKCTFSGTFNGKTTENSEDVIHSITFAIGEPYGNGVTSHNIEGRGKIYRHKLIGLFGIIDKSVDTGVSIHDVNFDGNIYVSARTDMYVGMAAAVASNKISFDNVDVLSTAKISHSGSGELKIGGILGQAASDIGDITVTNCDVNTEISGSATDICAGGVIGKIARADNESETWSFSNINIGGKIKNTLSISDNRVGGLVAVIAGSGSGASKRTLSLSGIQVNDLKIEVKAASDGTIGGTLGYSWLNVNTDFDNVNIGKVEVSGETQTVTTPVIENTDNSQSADFAGIVYQATGYWTVKNADDLKVNALSVKSEKAESFGMIVNKAWNESGSAVESVLYLELQNSAAYSIDPDNVSFKKISDNSTNMTIPIFDELVAYTSYYTGSGSSKCGYSGSDPDDLYILKNGKNGMISIQTAAPNGGLTMDGTTVSGTYTPFTEFGKQMNPYSRYYYNLYSLKSSSADSAKLMLWGARWYAHNSIKSSVSSDGWGSTIPNGTYDMVGYSWYPLDIDSHDVTLNNCTIKLYNREFELSEAAYTTGNHADAARTSLYNSGMTQHYLMQSALFRNVGAKLDVGTVTLQGSIPQIDTRTYDEDSGEQTGGDVYSGVLVMGTVKGSGATEGATAKVSTTSVILDGVYVYNFDLDSEDYAPLLINKTDDYSTLTINGVKVNNNASYLTSSSIKDIEENDRKVSGYTKIATSLIGNAGKNENSKNINISFSNIQLDGRKTHIETDLDSVYHTEASLFTEATLLNKLQFDTGKGTYTFKHSDDWEKTSAEDVTPETYDPKHNVTYGKEVGYTDTDVNTQYPGEERKYLGSDVYTDPTTASGDGSYAATFVSSYLPYVYKEYHKSNHPDWYQLEVNHTSSKFGGCGTYNDPYTLTVGADFDTIYKVLSTADDVNPGNIEINLPMSNATTDNISDTWHTIHGNYKYMVENPTDSENKAGYYLDGDYSKDYKSPKAVRTYVAGAYYKIEPTNDSDDTELNTITIDSSTFKGLGYTADNFAQFRGVIVGTGNETIINKTGYPIIAVSNGSVVKDVNIRVESARTIEQSVAKNFSEVPLEANCYGAVMGAVLGGDNIIDGVNVTFQNTTITLTGDAAQLIPVGGYVGVVEKGGVIFRGMEGKTGINGIPTGVVTAGSTPGVGDASLGDMVSETNMRWLYVNPIIGRVINGYAVTEASAYRPFEDGTRVYHGGARTLEDGTEDPNGLVTKYWDETNQTEVDTKPAKLSCVTMRNGNKHYSITDISITENKLDFDAKSSTDSTKDTTKPLVPNGQAFFLMSVMVNSGVAKNSLGYNQVYQVSRWAKYDDVGASASNADGSDWKTYAQKDRVDSTNSTEAKRTAKQSSAYLANFYTESASCAKTMANQTTTLKLSTANGNYVLPDGYKGIGNFFQNNDSYRMKITNLIGNNATISQNSYYYFYDSLDTIYPPNTGVQSGFGLINYYTANANGEFRDFYLTGNVKADLINNSNGNAITNKTAKQLDTGGTGAANSKYLSVGMLIGTMAKNLTVKNVSLTNIDVLGLRASGGLIGYIPDQTLTYEVESTVAASSYNSNMIKVHGRASTGGLVGKIRAGYAKVNMNNHTFNLTEVVCECQDRGKDSNYYDYGVGGFIGMMRAGQTDADLNANYFKNIIIGTTDKKQSVKCKDAEIFTAGVVGIMNKCKGITIDNCTFYNLSVEAKFAAAGLVAFPTTWTPAKVTNTHLYSPLGSTIESTTDYAGGFIGSSDPRTKDGNGSQAVTLNSCSVEGYTIAGAKGAGGIIGFRGAVDKDSKYYLTINNSKVYNCTIKSDGSAGGLIGEMNQPVVGYNVLVKNNSFDSYTSNGSIANKGYICGYITTSSENLTYKKGGNNTSSDDYTDKRRNTEPNIKISGFSRQADNLSTMEPELVGACNYGTGFGTGGYVIFADYNDNATNNPCSEFSNIVTSGTDVTTMRSKTTVVVETYENGELINTQTTVTYGDYKSSGLGTTTVYSDGTGTSQNYTITTTTVENENYPFVTTSKKTYIDNNGNFLTGDGLSSTVFNSSNFKTIVSQRNTAKGYKVCTELTDEQLKDISEHYISSHDIYGVVSGMLDFPLLTVDDTNATKTTALINNFVNTLANTDFEYEKNNAAFNISLHKCVWDEDAGSFTVYASDAENNTPCLKKNDSGFYFSADYVDTGSVPQFTLMDIQYYDPSSTATPKAVAYHLYIPIYVNQLLRFRYTAALASNTDYYIDAYSENLDLLFENLGNPVTMKFEYEYLRTPSEWASIINDGGSVLYNYYKTLELSEANSWPAGTKLILVDASNMDKHYYLDAPIGKTLDLWDFKDSNNQNFKPAPLQNLMKNAFVAEADINGKLVKTETESEATIKIGNDYYRPCNESDSGDKYKVYAALEVKQSNSGKLTVAANGTDATVKYNNVYYRPIEDSEFDPSSESYIEPANRYTTDSFDTERYYLSVFTKEYATTDLFKIQLNSKDSFEKSAAGKWESIEGWRPNKIETNANKPVTIIVGDLYENNLELDVTPMGYQNPNKYLMGKDNYFLTVQMTSQVKLKGDQIRQKTIASNMATTTSPIYQTFLMAYEKHDSSNNTEIGISTDAYGSVNKNSISYRIKGGDIAAADFDASSPSTIPDTQYEVNTGSQSFIELRNNESLTTYLAEYYAATLQVKYEIMYDPELLENQFPKRQTDDATSVGAMVKAYSKISSSKTSVPYSMTSTEADDKENNISHLYYTKDDDTAELTYEVKPTLSDAQRSAPKYGPYGGKYSYLGINAIENGDEESMIETTAVYNVKNVKNPGDYVELTLKLSAKENYSTYLDLTKYFSDLKIYGKNDVELYHYNGTTGTAADDVVATLDSTENCVKIRVNKSRLKSQGGTDSKMYEIPISYTVKTGDELFNDGAGGLAYSNYKVTVRAELYTTLTGGSANTASRDEDYIIYTNTKIDPKVF